MLIYKNEKSITLEKILVKSLFIGKPMTSSTISRMSIPTCDLFTVKKKLNTSRLIVVIKGVYSQMYRQKKTDLLIPTLPKLMTYYFDNRHPTCEPSLI